MIRKCVLVLCLVLVSLAMLAQGNRNQVDVVYLKNGSIIKGSIVHVIPDKEVKIQTADGSQFVFAMSEVKEISKEHPVKKYASRKSGTLKASAFGTGEIAYAFTGDSYLVGAHFLWGYRFTPHIMLSGGTGICVSENYEWDYDYFDGYYDDNSVGVAIPIFARFQVNFLRTRVSPFFMMDLGYMAALNDRGNSMAIVNPSLGVFVRIGRRFALNISLGYQVTEKEFVKCNYQHGKFYGDDDSNGATTLKIGFIF